MHFRQSRQWLALVTFSLSALVPSAGLAQMAQPAEPASEMAQANRIPSATEIQKAIEAAYREAKPIKEGKNADYIPYLAKVPSNLFSVAVVTVDGHPYTVGDDTHAFPIQSIAKPFTLARLLEQRGPAAVEKNIGVNATGQPFNSIVAMESNKDHPAGNPLVNPGAIATVSQLQASSGLERWNLISANLNAFAGKQLPLNEEVYKSETETNTRNQAITALLENAKVLKSDPHEALDIYTRECSVNVDTKELATMGATLANGGVNPLTGKRVVSADTAAKTLALMGTAGLYEDTGAWMYTVGAPAKSGVGGGLVAVVPGRFAVAAFSPPLDKAGNSVRAQKAIESVIRALGGNLYAAKSMPPMGVGGAGSTGGADSNPGEGH
jgi:glutaminase